MISADFQVIHPDDRNKILQTIEESEDTCLSGSANTEFRFPMNRSNGYFGNSIPDKMERRLHYMERVQCGHNRRRKQKRHFGRVRKDTEKYWRMY